MAKIKVTLEGGEYGTSVDEWSVPEDLVRPYSIFLRTWLSKGYAIVSGTIYEGLAQGKQPNEADMGALISQAGQD